MLDTTPNLAPLGMPLATIHVRGCHHGQMDCTLLLSVEGEMVATLDFSEYEGAPQIQMIKVLKDKLRRGYATHLLSVLQARYPDQEIDWGSMTDKGVALRAALPKRSIPTPEAPLFARLARLQKRLISLEQQIARAHAAGAPTEATITAYYCLEAHISDLEWRLDRCKASLTLLDLPTQMAA